jgi:hypothetical protein
MTAWLAIGLSVLLNLVTLAGVVALAWPPGNVFLLFWYENVVLGLCTVVRVATARGTDAPGARSRLRFTVNDRDVAPPSSRGGYVAFFLLHYGIFCVVHLVFTVVVAVIVGTETSWLFLGLPVVLVLVRYGVELAATWFGRDGLRGQTSPGRAMMQPYPRIVVLQLGVIVGFALVLVGSFGRAGGGTGPFDQASRLLEPLLALLPAGRAGLGVLAVGFLLLVKTVVDVLTTRRALRAG